MVKELFSMVTGFPKGKLPYPKAAEVAREAAAGGMVLLKNDGILPLKPQKVALFGVGAEDTVTCGTGSGYAFTPYTVSVRQGLENAGFKITSSSWLRRYWQEKKAVMKSEKKLSLLDKYFSGITYYPNDPKISQIELKEAKEADTAIYVISRNTGENFDRKPEKGDYYLSYYEEENLGILTKNFEHVIVVLNTCVLDAAELENMPGISAILLMGQAGLESGNAAADVLTGKTDASGRLTDTWACSYDDYPASATFSVNDGDPHQEDYTEDIFVGYRYFDSFGKKVIYPFGYGLSYTSFEETVTEVTADWNEVRVSVEVRNTGARAGREVVQLYVSAPQGELVKPYQELKGYAKTGTIEPGRTETVTVTFPTESMASFSEKESAWVMEAGDYLLRVGRHSRDTEICAAVRLDRTALLRRTADCLAPDHELDLIRPTVRERETYDGRILTLKAEEAPLYERTEIDPTIISYVPEGREYSVPERKWQFSEDQKEAVKTVRDVPSATLFDVKDGTVTMEEFVASLDKEVLLRLVTGNAAETPYAAENRLGKNRNKSNLASAASGKTTAQYVSTLGIPAAALADGPAGLHLMGSYAASYPVGMVIAQNWDDAVAAKVGDSVGTEMELANASILLGPGMNIHRDPLCGRNFEYYSEDPVVTGRTAASFTRSLQGSHPGYGVAIKHFATNNQETDRTTGNNTVSRRALREIYLKGFEICIRDANPISVMSSYNCLNGFHTSSSYELLTEVLRGDWGFKGFVMTDWDSQSSKDTDIHAGNDIIMGGYPTSILSGMYDGTAPSFDDDGAVHQDKIKTYGGAFSRQVDAWGSFVAEADGKEEIRVTVASGKEISERVKPLIESGAAVVETGSDGSKTVVYHGTNRGAYLPLGDLQRNAMRILTWLMNNAPMQKMIRK